MAIYINYASASVNHLLGGTVAYYSLAYDSNSGYTLSMYCGDPNGDNVVFQISYLRMKDYRLLLKLMSILELTPSATLTSKLINFTAPTNDSHLAFSASGASTMAEIMDGIRTYANLHLSDLQDFKVITAKLLNSDVDGPTAIGAPALQSTYFMTIGELNPDTNVPIGKPVNITMNGTGFGPVETEVYSLVFTDVAVPHNPVIPTAPIVFNIETSCNIGIDTTLLVTETTYDYIAYIINSEGAQVSNRFNWRMDTNL